MKLNVYVIQDIFGLCENYKININILVEVSLLIIENAMNNLCGLYTRIADTYLILLLLLWMETISN